MVEKGKWVLIRRTVLEPGERAPQAPEDTREVPLRMWIKGTLQKRAAIGEEVTVLTRTGRIETGTLLEENPYYKHDFGKCVPELMAISDQVREMVFGGEGE